MKKLSQRVFPRQNTLLHNFIPTQPIHTNSNSIDAARQAEYNTKLKNVKISIQGAISSIIPPKGSSKPKIKMCQ
jgi:hypothetical protein